MSKIEDTLNEVSESAQIEGIVFTVIIYNDALRIIKEESEQQSIAFHNWTLDNHYMSIMRNKERMFFQPMQAPLHTHTELYQLFLNDQNK